MGKVQYVCVCAGCGWEMGWCTRMRGGSISTFKTRLVGFILRRIVLMLWHGVWAERRLKKSPCLRVRTDRLTGNPPKRKTSIEGLQQQGCSTPMPVQGGLQGSLAVGCS